MIANNRASERSKPLLLIHEESFRIEYLVHERYLTV
jgi:hypothetical protein